MDGTVLQFSICWFMGRTELVQTVCTDRTLFLHPCISLEMRTCLFHSSLYPPSNTHTSLLLPLSTFTCPLPSHPPWPTCSLLSLPPHLLSSIPTPHIYPLPPHLPTSLFSRHPRKHGIENVVVPLHGVLTYNTVLLKKVCGEQLSRKLTQL